MKKLISKLNLFLIAISQRAFGFIKNCIKPSIEVVEQIKQIVDSKIVDTITTLTPQDLDNIAIAKLREILPLLLDVLKAVEPFKACADLEDNKVMLDCFLVTLNKISKDERLLFKRILSIIAEKLITKEAENRDIDVTNFNLSKLIEATYATYNKK